MLDKIQTLKEAVITAREKANQVEVTPAKIGDVVLSYVFGNNLV